VLTESLAVWVKWWTEANAVKPNQSVGMYMGIFAMLGGLGTVGATVAAWYVRHSYSSFSP